MSTIYCKINQQVESMSKANSLALRLIKKGQESENKVDNLNLFSRCQVCYGSAFLITYQNGVRGAKRCPKAVWDESKKKYVCELGSITNGQITHRQNQEELLKLIRRIVARLRINANMFLATIKEFFQVSDLNQLAFQQLELILHKLKLAEKFKLELIQANQLPQQQLITLSQIPKVA